MQAGPALYLLSSAILRTLIGEAMKTIGRFGRFAIIAAVIGIAAPFLISVCLFGSTLQSFVSGAQPTPGYWSGAPTAVPTPVPGPVQAWTRSAFSASGGALFIVWSVLGALGGEALALYRARDELNPVPHALLGALAGSLVFIGISLCGFLK